MLIKGLLRTLLCTVLLSATTAWAAEIHGRSSTQFVWFNNLFNDRKQTEIAEYLQLSITKIDSAGKFSIYGYGRGTQDLDNGEGLNGRLYYLYGDYRGLFDKVDLRVGRHELVRLDHHLGALGRLFTYRQQADGGALEAQHLLGEDRAQHAELAQRFYPQRMVFGITQDIERHH